MNKRAQDSQTISLFESLHIEVPVRLTSRTGTRASTALLGGAGESRRESQAQRRRQQAAVLSETLARAKARQMSLIAGDELSDIATGQRPEADTPEAIQRFLADRVAVPTVGFSLSKTEARAEVPPTSIDGIEDILDVLGSSDGPEMLRIMEEIYSVDPEALSSPLTDSPAIGTDDAPQRTGKADAEIPPSANSDPAAAPAQESTNSASAELSKDPTARAGRGKKATKRSTATKTAEKTPKPADSTDDELARLIASQAADERGEEIEDVHADDEYGRLEGADVGLLGADFDGDTDEVRADQADPYALSSETLDQDAAEDPAQRVLRRFMREISQFERLTPEEERELAIKIEAGDEAAVTKMIEHNIALVAYFAKGYVHRAKSMTMDDLIQEGTIGLTIAARKFRAEHGTRFSTYAVHWICQSIGRALAYKDDMIHITETGHKRLKSWAAKAAEASANNDPMAATYQREYELEAAKIAPTNQRTGVVDLHSPIGSSDSEGATLADVLADEVDVESAVGARETVAIVLEVIDHMEDDRLRDILCMRKGINAEQYQYTLQEVAEKYGTSRERARQLEVMAVDIFMRMFRSRCASLDDLPIDTTLIREITESSPMDVAQSGLFAPQNIARTMMDSARRQ